MYFELALLAYSLDLLIGELPCKHPVMFMGDVISAFEQRFYRDRVTTGLALVLGLISCVYLASVAIVAVSQWLPNWLGLVLLSVCASTGLAMNMLHGSVAHIITAEQPKLALSYLVSRDTEAMTETDIIKAALETWAENLSDGVIAPLFYLLLFGLPGIAVYKAINTLDSMVAYKTPHYINFGKAAALLDDAANYLPARLTAVLIVLIAADKELAWQCLIRDGNNLESPNAGYPIAAMAGALGVALGGDASYHGQLKHKPSLGLAKRPLTVGVLTEALAMKPRINGVVLGLLFLGSWLA